MQTGTESEELGRWRDGQVSCPSRFYAYDGQAIIRTRRSTHQCWTEPGSEFPFPFASDYCTPNSSALAVKNEELDLHELTIKYVEDGETVYYDVEEP